MPDPRSALAARRRPRAVATRRPRARSPGRTRPGGPAPWRTRSSTSSTSGTFSPEGTFDGRHRAASTTSCGLGVTHVELMPVNAFPGVHGWGYDGVALFAPHEPYGGPDGLKRLVDACHARGLAVLLDVVYNHLGPDGNYTGAFGPYQTDRYRTPWGAAVNLDGPGSDEVRRFFVDNALDAGSATTTSMGCGSTPSTPSSTCPRRTSSSSWRTRCARCAEASGRGFVLIAESDLNDPRLVRPPDGRWLRPRRHLERRPPPRAPRHADRRAVAATTRTSSGFAGHRAGDDRRVRLRRPPLGAPRSGPRAGRRRPGRRGGSSASARTTTRSATAPPGSASRTSPASMPRGSPRPSSLRARSCRSSSRARSGPRRRRSSTSPTTRTRTLPAPSATGRRREFAAFGWAAGPGAGPAGPGDVRSVAAGLGASSASTPHAEMLDWYRRLIALRRDDPGLRDGRRPGRPRRRDGGLDRPRSRRRRRWWRTSGRRPSRCRGATGDRPAARAGGSRRDPTGRDRVDAASGIAHASDERRGRRRTGAPTSDRAFDTRRDRGLGSGRAADAPPRGPARSPTDDPGRSHPRSDSRDHRCPRGTRSQTGTCPTTGAGAPSSRRSPRRWTAAGSRSSASSATSVVVEADAFADGHDVVTVRARPSPARRSRMDGGAHGGARQRPVARLDSGCRHSGGTPTPSPPGPTPGRRGGATCASGSRPARTSASTS